MDDVAVQKPVDQPRFSGEPQDSLDAMKIAWRYQNLPKLQVNSIHFIMSVIIIAVYLE